MKSKGYLFLLVLAVTLSLMPLAARTQLIHQKVVRTEEFEVVDETGKTRVKIGIAPDGRAFLHIYDQNGRIIWEAPPPAPLFPDDKLVQRRKLPQIP